MAKHINRFFRPFKDVAPERLLFANGVTALFSMLGQTICDAGDAVLVSSPCYQGFKGDFEVEAKSVTVLDRRYHIGANIS